MREEYDLSKMKSRPNPYVKQTITKSKESQLEKFHSLINKSNNKTKLTMKIATETSEIRIKPLFQYLFKNSSKLKTSKPSILDNCLSLEINIAPFTKAVAHIILSGNLIP